MTDKLSRNLTAGIAALVAFITYFLTVAPTLSFWDCGEFIASAYSLGIPHPPGTPFFVFFARAFIVLLPMVEEVAKRVNYISVIFSAATVYFVALFVWDLLSKLMGNVSKVILIAASLSAGFLLTFSDTFWFNAVEAEVYGLAMFIVVLISYLALKYLDCKDENLGLRYLVFICYLAFLGIGVHLYTMITIPAIFVLLLLADGTPFKTFKERLPIWITGTVLFSVVYAVSKFLSWSFILLFVLFIIYIAIRKSSNLNLKRDIGLSLAFTVVAIIGYSTHLYIPIRSELNPIIDENNPEINFRDENGKLQLGNLLPTGENWRAFNDFLERKQYGSESMITRSFYRRSQLDNQFMVFPHMGFGGYQIAQYTPFKVGEVTYYQNGIYNIEAEGNEPLVRGSLQFPTLMSSIGENEAFQAVLFLLFNGLLVWIIVIAYRKNKTIGIYLAMLYGICAAGLIWYVNFSDGTKPEGREREMWVKEMQYFAAEVAPGTKIPDPNVLLNIRRKIALGDNGAASSNEWQNWSRIKSAFESRGIPAELPNPVHLEVRERDYFFTPAFIFMSLFYGVGIGFLLLSIQQKRPALLLPKAIGITVLCGAIPLFANYKEHNRAGLWAPWDYAYNLLMSCEPNAILFTNGDNDTFPLWFAQEVAGIRKDVRVVNLSLGNTDWYINQMLDNEPILKLSYDKTGIEKEMVLSEDNYEQPSQRIDFWVKKAEQAIPVLTRQVELLEEKGDSLELFKRKVWLQTYTALKDWGEPRRAGIMQTQYKLVMDLTMNNLDKPIHVSTTVGLSNAVGLEKYMVQKGMIWDLVKGSLTPTNDSMDIERTAELVDSVFKYRGLGDGTAFINTETEQLLFNYNSMYIRLAMAKENSLERSLHYAELGMKQFPSEWRNYVVAAEILTKDLQIERAVEYLEKGLTVVPAASANRYLLPQLNLLKNRE